MTARVANQLPVKPVRAGARVPLLACPAVPSRVERGVLSSTVLCERRDVSRRRTNTAGQASSGTRREKPVLQRPHFLTATTARRNPCPHNNFRANPFAIPKRCCCKTPSDGDQSPPALENRERADQQTVKPVRAGETSPFTTRPTRPPWSCRRRRSRARACRPAGASCRPR
jgi:hypothetical protein